ncbi:biotin/lipoyl-binding protein [Candidatus Nomurabacteria bacterium]|nr:biotin/lipoyl-binding protein [Candidatus Nomurabacteria bacterium]
MKNTIIKFLSKPKIIIPSFAVLMIIIIGINYKNIGKAPIVDIKLENSAGMATSIANTINLSFPKSGRVEKVSIVTGQKVYKGEILAKLVSPDGEGQVAAAKGALDLAEAQYASLNLQYKNAKSQQDLIVKNAYQTLLSSGLEGIPSEQDQNTPVITGTYSCEKEGSYEIAPYQSSDSDTGLSFNYKGVETGTGAIKYDNSVPLGDCGLQIKWKHVTYFNPNTKWTIDIPNTKSSVYLANKNAYELALESRDKILSELLTTIGSDTSKTSVATAQVNAAKGAYEAALGAYQNNIITAPSDGIISFVDKDLKVGQGVVANKNIICIVTK